MTEADKVVRSHMYRALESIQYGVTADNLRYALGHLSDALYVANKANSFEAKPSIFRAMNRVRARIRILSKGAA